MVWIAEGGSFYEWIFISRDSIFHAFDNNGGLMSILEKTIKLPAVRGVHLMFDIMFIRKCLRKHETIEGWPELIKKQYRDAKLAENKLLHIESVCRKARIERIEPFKKRLEKIMLCHSNKILP